jgi:hypothetical protein
MLTNFVEGLAHTLQLSKEPLMLAFTCPVPKPPLCKSAPFHGLLAAGAGRGGVTDAWIAQQQQQGPAAGVGLSLFESGAKKILRLLPRLRPGDCMLHMALLEAITRAQPALTAEYIGTTSVMMEPQVSDILLA